MAWILKQSYGGENHKIPDTQWIWIEGYQPTEEKTPGVGQVKSNGNVAQYESTDRMVSHPDHYQGKNGIEVIDVIEAFTTGLDGIFATDTGNIIKYACRWNSKGNPIQDVEKIIWYATHLLNKLKEKEIAKEEEALGYTE